MDINDILNILKDAAAQALLAARESKCFDDVKEKIFALQEDLTTIPNHNRCEHCDRWYHINDSSGPVLNEWNERTCAKCQEEHEEQEARAHRGRGYLI